MQFVALTPYLLPWANLPSSMLIDFIQVALQTPVRSWLIFCRFPFVSYICDTDGLWNICCASSDWAYYFLKLVPCMVGEWRRLYLVCWTGCLLHLFFWDMRGIALSMVSTRNFLFSCKYMVFSLFTWFFCVFTWFFLYTHKSLSSYLDITLGGEAFGVLWCGWLFLSEEITLGDCVSIIGGGVLLRDEEWLLAVTVHFVPRLLPTMKGLLMREDFWVA